MLLTRQNTRMRKGVFAIGAVGLLMVMSREPLRAEEAHAQNGKPLWEAGLFVGVARLPHYPGSDEYSLYALPLPYIVYRGERVRATREGLAGVLFSSDRVQSTVSAYGNPPPAVATKPERGWRICNRWQKRGRRCEST